MSRFIPGDAKLRGSDMGGWLMWPVAALGIACIVAAFVAWTDPELRSELAGSRITAIESR
jgi:hypothetical protein